MAIKIFDKCWYVTAKERKDEDGILAYMCQVDSESSFKAKMQTGTQWAGYSYEHQVPEVGVYFDNKPTTGFYIGTSVARYSTANKLFRVLDPRGFVVEVPTGNIATLLHLTTVKNGFVQEECVWGREGSNHILLPVNSQPYQDGLKNSVSKADMVKVGTLKKGDLCTISCQGSILKNAIYMGKEFNWRYTLHDFVPGNRWSTEIRDEVLSEGTFTEKRKNHLFLIENINDAGMGYMFYDIKNPNILEVTGHTQEIKEVPAHYWDLVGYGDILRHIEGAFKKDSIVEEHDRNIYPYVPEKRVYEREVRCFKVYTGKQW